MRQPKLSHPKFKNPGLLWSGLAQGHNFFLIWIIRS